MYVERGPVGLVSVVEEKKRLYDVTSGVWLSMEL